MNDPNRAALEVVAEALGPLNEEVVYVGGAVVGLLVTDPAAPSIRPTDDVDCIVDAATRSEYDGRIRNLLISRGFSELSGPGTPMCAWQIGGLRVDVMPTDESILGFASSWHASAIRTADRVDLGTSTIHVITAPYFIAAKLEAFHSRGDGDYLASHDIEDIIAVLDGRPSAPNEVLIAASNVREYIAKQFGVLLADEGFVNVLPGLALEPGRSTVVWERLSRIAAGR